MGRCGPHPFCMPGSQGLLTSCAMPVLQIVNRMECESATLRNPDDMAAWDVFCELRMSAIVESLGQPFARECLTRAYLPREHEGPGADVRAVTLTYIAEIVEGGDDAGSHRQRRRGWLRLLPPYRSR